MNPSWQLESLDEAELGQLAERLARTVEGGGVIFLQGDLGAGKTTFARALLRGLGVAERIKSPTYSLIESYDVNGLRAHHLDLYRIADASELEWLGLDDLLDDASLLLVEWPERAARALPGADLLLELSHRDARRDLRASALSARGAQILARWRD